jgi:uncharacterized protein YndB with AHSA1/START domain
MWESTVQVERSRVVDTSAERAWSLLASPAVWSLRPTASFAFDIPWSLPEAGRLRLYIGATTRGVGSVVYEARDEAPGQLICWQTRSTVPVGRQVYTLRVRPARRGVTVGLVVRHIVPRAWKVSHQAYLRKDLTDWLKAMQAVLEDRRPWPGPEMPVDVRQACAASPVLRGQVSVSAAVLISAPVAQVWEAVSAAETAPVVAPESLAFAGHVPGTPKQQVGEMQYFLFRPVADGRLAATVHVVRELTDRQYALTQRIGPPHEQMTYSLTPAPGGTRLELAAGWPEGTLTGGSGGSRTALAEGMQALADAYKELIEESAGQR